MGIVFCLVGWLFSWRTGLLNGWLVELLAGWLIDSLGLTNEFFLLMSWLVD